MADAWTAGQTVALAILAIAVLVGVLAWRRLTRRPGHPARHRFVDGGVRTSPFAAPLANAHDLDWPRATTIELKFADRGDAPWQERRRPPDFTSWL